MAGGVTIKLHSTGPDVAVWQGILGIAQDGVFGPETERRTVLYQESNGLVGDGIVGPRTWARALHWSEIPTTPKLGADLRAPACRAALRDANTRWPHRSRVSDGILGDARHQATKSDHNLGNAVDITARADTGYPETPRGSDLAAMAMTDRRTQYVIWDGRIWNVDRAEGWREYHGANPHRHHVHISIKASLRDDEGPWPW